MHAYSTAKPHASIGFSASAQVIDKKCFTGVAAPCAPPTAAAVEPGPLQATRPACRWLFL